MVDYWTKKLSFHLSSHILHSIFWTNLTKRSSAPSDALLKKIEKDFGSLDKMQGLLSKLSKSIEGSGWGVLAYQPQSDTLVILQCENHHKLTIWGAVQLLVIDVWEHAYYLKYKNDRGKYIDAFYKLLCWKMANKRFMKEQY